MLAMLLVAALARRPAPRRRRTDDRRYDIRDDVLIRTHDGATLSATVIRPKGATQPLPTLLTLDIYTDPAGFAARGKDAADHGYIAVTADTRGKRLSTAPIEPYEHEAGRCLRRHRLDRAPAVERRAGRHARRQLLRLHRLGGHQAPAPGAEDHRGIGGRDPGAGPAHGEQHLPQCELRLGVLRRRQPLPGREDLQRQRALVGAAGQVVRERPPLPRHRRHRRHAEPVAAALAQASGLRRLLAGDGAVPAGLRAHRHPGAHRHRLLRRRPGLGARVRARAPPLPPRRRGLRGHRSLRSLRHAPQPEGPGAARLHHRPGGAVQHPGALLRVDGLRAARRAEAPVLVDRINYGHGGERVAPRALARGHGEGPRAAVFQRHARQAREGPLPADRRGAQGLRPQAEDRPRRLTACSTTHYYPDPIIEKKLDR